VHRGFNPPSDVRLLSLTFEEELVQSRSPLVTATCVSVILGAVYLGVAVAGRFLLDDGTMGTIVSAILTIAVVVAFFAALASARRRAGSMAVAATAIIGGGSAASYLCGAIVLQHLGLQLNVSLSWQAALVGVAASAIGGVFLAGIPLRSRRADSGVGREAAAGAGHLADPLSTSSNRAQKSYADSWRLYRRLRRTQWIGVLIPLVGVPLFFTLDRWIPLAAELLAPISLTAGFITLVVARIRLGRFRCPRCTEDFFRRRTRWLEYSNPFARRCLNCGLPKWAEEARDSPAA
jgi:MFS family permease